MNRFVALLIVFELFISVSFISAQEAPALQNKDKIKKSLIKTRTEYLYFLDKPEKKHFLMHKRYYDRVGNDTLIEEFSLIDNSVFTKSRKIFDECNRWVEKIDLKIFPDSQVKSTAQDKTKGKILAVELITKFEYDEKNNLIRKVLYDSAGEKLKSYSFVYKYSGSKIIELKSFGDATSEFSREEFVYDDNGREKIHITYDKTGLKKNKNEYFYDSAGNQLCVKFFNSNGELFETDSLFYNQLGNRIKRIKYNKNFVKAWSIDFSYNKKNNMVKSVREYYIHEVDYKRMVTTFDKNGNILSMTKFDKKLKPIRMQKYVYTFY